MNTLPYREAFDRIRAEFSEMPGMRLVPEQVERLSGLDHAVCQCVLDDLVRAKFLQRLPNGSYARVSDTFESTSSSLPSERRFDPQMRTRRAS
jgi:hypothetical protein